MNMPAGKAVRAVISGRVQGVFFRAWTTEEACRRGLRGWVRNCRDGTVEAVFAGPAEQVDEMIRVCHRGPPRARVAGVSITPVDEPDEPGFHQIRSY